MSNPKYQDFLQDAQELIERVIRRANQPLRGYIQYKTGLKLRQINGEVPLLWFPSVLPSDDSTESQSEEDQ
jgi:hypothetical protein